MLAWDRSTDWVLERFRNDRTRITIQFGQVRPSVAELAAIRRCLPKFQRMAPAEIRAAVGESGELVLGDYPSPMARLVINAVEAQGLQVVAEETAVVSYVPFDRTSGCAWLIDDAAEAAAVVAAMLAAGVPVRDVGA